MDKPMTQIKNKPTKDDQGVALIATLMFLVAMGILSTALISTLNNEMKASASYKYGEQAFYVANAGVQESIQWFANSYTPWVPASAYDTATLPVSFGGSPVLLAAQDGSTTVYPGGTVPGNFAAQFHNRALQANTSNTGAYALNATLLKYKSAHFINPTTFVSYVSAIERWRVDSVGYWGPNIAQPLGTAEITAIVENSGNALFDRALWGIDGLDLGGTVLVDSYDPKLGPYGGTNIGSEGSVGSNMTVSATGSVDIKGDLAFGPTGSYTHAGNPTVTGDIIQLAEPRYFPPIPDFSAQVGTTNLNPKNGTTTINPGSYGAIDIGAKGVLALNPGVYYFDSIKQAATGSLQINGNLSTDTTIFVKSSLDLSGQGVVNLNGDPTRLTIYYAGTSEMKIAGGASAFVEVYAPNSPLRFVGTSDFFGSFIGKTVAIQGTPEVHFDEGCLEKNLLQRPFRLVTWSKNAF
jgi:hypothetical protein